MGQMNALLPLLPGLPPPDAHAAAAGCTCMGAQGGIAGIVLKPDEDGDRRQRWFFYSVSCKLHGRAASEKLKVEEPITL